MVNNDELQNGFEKCADANAVDHQNVTDGEWEAQGAVAWQSRPGGDATADGGHWEPCSRYYYEQELLRDSVDVRALFTHALPAHCTIENPCGQVECGYCRNKKNNHQVRDFPMSTTERF